MGTWLGCDSASENPSDDEPYGVPLGITKVLTLKEMLASLSRSNRKRYDPDVEAKIKQLNDEMELGSIGSNVCFKITNNESHLDVKQIDIEMPNKETSASQTASPTTKTKTSSTPRLSTPASPGPAHAREQQHRRSAIARTWTEHQLVSFRLMAIKDCRVAAVAQRHLERNRMDIQLGLIDDIMVFDLFTEKSLKIPERFDYVPSIHPVIQ